MIRIKENKINLIHLIVIAGVMFVTASVYVTLQTASSGAKLAKLEKQLQELQVENRNMNEQLVRASSLTKISEQASVLGFVKASEILYIEIDESMASAR